MGVLLVVMTFFSSMLVTNDVALMTFVPFAVVLLGMTGRRQDLIKVVVLQTVAANLGSMLTPVGNPQNLYLYSRYALSASEFFRITAPAWPRRGSAPSSSISAAAGRRASATAGRKR